MSFQLCFVPVSYLSDSVNMCIKNSHLYHNGTIEPRFLTINERVRQFGGHPTYAKFLMFMGLGLLERERETLYFKSVDTAQFINIPEKIEGTTIVKQFSGNEILFFIYLLY